MAEKQIEVDEDNKNVIIHSPHAISHDVADFENTTFEDIEKGILAFGDLALSLEEQNELEKRMRLPRLGPRKFSIRLFKQ